MILSDGQFAGIGGPLEIYSRLVATGFNDSQLFDQNIHHQFLRDNGFEDHMHPVMIKLVANMMTKSNTPFFLLMEIHHDNS